MGTAHSMHERNKTRYKISAVTLRKGGQMGSLTCRWEHNIKMGLSDIQCRVWTGVIWLRKGFIDSLL